MRIDDPQNNSFDVRSIDSGAVVPRLRFASTLRLKGDERIRRIYHSPHQFKHRYMRCYYALQADRPCPGHPPIQFAFAIPKRRFRRAHDRHYIRRRLREALRLTQHTWRPWFANVPATLGVYLLYLGHAEPTVVKLKPFLLEILRRIADSLPRVQSDLAATATITPSDTPACIATPAPDTQSQLPG